MTILLRRTESGLEPVDPPPSPAAVSPVKEETPTELEEGELPPSPPSTPTPRKRKRKTKRPNQGDTPHLQKWREFYKLWHTKHGEHETVKALNTVGKAKAAGVAYRHSRGKKRATDPDEPEFAI